MAEQLTVYASPKLIYALGQAAGKPGTPFSETILVRGVDADRVELLATDRTSALLVDIETPHNIPSGSWAKVSPLITKMPEPRVLRAGWVDITCVPVEPPEQDPFQRMNGLLEAGSDGFTPRVDPSLLAKLSRVMGMLCEQVSFSSYDGEIPMISMRADGGDSNTLIVGFLAQRVAVLPEDDADG